MGWLISMNKELGREGLVSLRALHKDMTNLEIGHEEYAGLAYDHITLRHANERLKDLLNSISEAEGKLAETTETRDRLAKENSDLVKTNSDWVRANDAQKFRYNTLNQSVQQLENKRSEINHFVKDFWNSSMMRELEKYMDLGIMSMLAERRPILNLALFAVVLSFRQDQNMYYLLDSSLMLHVISNPNQLPSHMEWKKLHQFQLFKTMSEYNFDIVRNEIKDKLMSGKIFERYPELVKDVLEKDRQKIIKMLSDKWLLS